MMQSKRVFWQYELEGERDLEQEIQKLILETADEYKQQAESTGKAIRTVRNETKIKYNVVKCNVLYTNTRISH